MVYLIRHTAPGVDARICYGRLDVSLAHTAAGEIALVLATLPRVDAIISSPARRCTLLATAVSARDRAALRTDARLLEIDFGTWEGQAWAALPRVELDAWAADTWRVRPGSGESLLSLWRRIAGFRADHLTPAAISSPTAILIVSHQGPLRVLWAQENGSTPAEIFNDGFAYGMPGLRALATVTECSSRSSIQVCRSSPQQQPRDGGMVDAGRIWRSSVDLDGQSSGLR